MTTAGRPTWTPAVGGSGRSQAGNRVHAPIRQFSSRDMKSHTKLKLRQPGQNAPSDLQQRDLKEELDERERKHFKKSKDILEEIQEKEELALLEDKKEPDEESVKNVDADDSDSDAESSAKESSDEEEEEEDEEQELLKELNRIKEEREAEAKRKLLEEMKEEAEAKEKEALVSNPLLAQADFTVKKRWYDDTVFKNQARGEIQTPKRFINDTIRNDFHRKFLAKYIQ